MQSNDNSASVRTEVDGEGKEWKVVTLPPTPVFRSDLLFRGGTYIGKRAPNLSQTKGMGSYL